MGCLSVNVTKFFQDILLNYDGSQLLEGKKLENFTVGLGPQLNVT